MLSIPTLLWLEENSSEARWEERAFSPSLIFMTIFYFRCWGVNMLIQGGEAARQCKQMTDYTAQHTVSFTDMVSTAKYNQNEGLFLILSKFDLYRTN